MIDSSISAETIESAISWLAGFTEKPGEQGVTRPLYTKSWKQALFALRQRFEKLGMTVEFDQVGNLIATVEGCEQP